MSLFDNFDQVSWRELQGNKYTKSLDLGMLTEVGSPHIVRATLKGSSKDKGQPQIVIYDQDYVINWLIVKLIKPLSNYGLEGVTNLVEKAWAESDLSTESLATYDIELVNEEK